MMSALRLYPLRTHSLSFPPNQHSKLPTQHHLPHSILSNLRFYSTQPPKSNPPNQNPSMGGASFKDLGANRTVKIVVYFSLGVIATVESFTWGKLLWRRFGPASKSNGGDD
ncbi:hypothetical protein N431DRAFT_428730, partial [Stipitochalara longipes BDJ]